MYRGLRIGKVGVVAPIASTEGAIAALLVGGRTGRAADPCGGVCPGSDRGRGGDRHLPRQARPTWICGRRCSPSAPRRASESGWSRRRGPVLIWGPTGRSPVARVVGIAIVVSAAAACPAAPVARPRLVDGRVLGAGGGDRLRHLRARLATKHRHLGGAGIPVRRRGGSWARTLIYGERLGRAPAGGSGRDHRRCDAAGAGAIRLSYQANPGGQLVLDPAPWAGRRSASSASRRPGTPSAWGSRGCRTWSRFRCCRPRSPS